MTTPHLDLESARQSLPADHLELHRRARADRAKALAELIEWARTRLEAAARPKPLPMA